VPIVDAAVFERARRIIESRHQHLTDQDLLERLRELLRRHGRLSGLLIDETETMPSSSCYSTRFGSLVRAYTLIGWEPDRDFSYVEINRSIRRRHADLISAIFDELLALGATVRVDPQTDLLKINSAAARRAAGCFERDLPDTDAIAPYGTSKRRNSFANGPERASHQRIVSL
jgi:hypothetical protein